MTIPYPMDNYIWVNGHYVTRPDPAIARKWKSVKREKLYIDLRP